MSLRRASNVVSLAGRVLAGVGSGLETAAARPRWSPFFLTLALGAVAGAAAALFVKRRLDEGSTVRPTPQRATPQREPSRGEVPRDSTADGGTFEAPFE